MCRGYYIDGDCAETFAQLVALTGREPIVLLDDYWEPEPGACLCPVDAEKTAANLGRVVKDSVGLDWELVKP